MTDYIPTIEELLSKPESELHAIFREASAVAADTTRDPAVQRAAAQTAENVRRCLPHQPCL